MTPELEEPKFRPYTWTLFNGVVILTSEGKLKPPSLWVRLTTKLFFGCDFKWKDHAA
jgi:hypothetical protein